MKLTKFYEMIEADKELKGIAVDHVLKTVTIEEVKAGAHTSLPISTVMTHPWGLIRAVCVAERSPRLLSHVSRVVGYFSRIDNWNDSKIGELLDRQRGNYALKGKDGPVQASMPS